MRKVERCTIGECQHEAEGACASCGRLLCYVHTFEQEKQRYCHACYDKLIVRQMQSRALRDW